MRRQARRGCSARVLGVQLDLAVGRKRRAHWRRRGAHLPGAVVDDPEQPAAGSAVGRWLESLPPPTNPRPNTSAATAATPAAASATAMTRPALLRRPRGSTIFAVGPATVGSILRVCAVALELPPTSRRVRPVRALAACIAAAPSSPAVE